jgi:hypothetical protein
MVNDIYETNIIILRELYGENFIEEISDNDNDNIVLEKAKNGDYTIKLVEDKERYITSKYNPSKEAERYVNNIEEYNNETLFIVYGLALGYHITELNNKLSGDNQILIIEPSLSAFKKLLEVRDISSLTNNDNIHIFVGNKASITKFYNTYINHYNVNNIIVTTFAQYNKLFEEYYNKSLTKLKECMINIQIGINTQKCFCYELNKNIFENLKCICHSNNIQDLKGKCTGIPAIIVSAGPSLDKNIAELKNVKDRALIIAGGRTLKTLLENNIKPHLVVSLDPGKGAYEVINENLNCDVPLITNIASNSKVINEYRGEKIFSNSDEGKELVKQLTNKEIDVILQGGSVANFSMSIADYIGCDPIILIGQDLAYTDGKCHSEGALIKEINKEQNKVDNESGIEIEDIYNNKVLTNGVWLSFLRWFESYIQYYTDKEVIDATEGGAKIKGTKIMTLKDTIDKYCHSDREIDKKICSILKANKHEQFNFKTFSKNIRRLRRDLVEINKSVNTGINFSKRMLDYYVENANVNIQQILRKLDEIDNRVKTYKSLDGAVGHLLSPIIYQVYQNKDFQEKINETENERGIRLAKKSLVLYNGIEKCIKEAMKLIDVII